VDRDVAGRGVVLEAIEQHPTVDIGQAQIERDRIRFDDARELEGTTPLKPAARAVSSSVIAKPTSSSTTSTTRSPGWICS